MPSLNKIIRDIKAIKIQGARNIAKAALIAYLNNKTKQTKKKLIKARKTEPMLVNVLNKAEKARTEKEYREIISHFDEAQNKINKYVFKIIKNNDIIFTHCHSTNVVNALIYAKKKGKKFQVYNTETRPLFQGRKTALELKRAGIKVTMFVDSAMKLAIEKSDKIFLGADAILNKGAINKVGSSAISELAKNKKKPAYIIADSWKFSKQNVKIEERSFKEIWKNAPKHIKIKNPAFELVEKKYIKAIVSELGILNYDGFLRKTSKVFK